MQNNSLDKYIKLSRIAMAFLMFIVIDIEILFVSHDISQLLSAIISSGFIALIMYAITSQSSKICKFIINKWDKMNNNTLSPIFYILAFPIGCILFISLPIIAIALIVGLMPIFARLVKMGISDVLAFVTYSIIAIFLAFVAISFIQITIIMIIRYFSEVKNNQK